MENETNLTLEDLNKMKEILRLLDPNSNVFSQSIDLIDNKKKNLKLGEEKNTEVRDK